MEKVLHSINPIESNIDKLVKWFLSPSTCNFLTNKCIMLRWSSIINC